MKAFDIQTYRNGKLDMNTTLKITIKSVYGKETIYPACEQSRRLADMVGTKTLTQDTVRQAIAMGFRVEYVDAFKARYAA